MLDLDPEENVYSSLTYLIQGFTVQSEYPIRFLRSSDICDDRNGS